MFERNAKSLIQNIMSGTGLQLSSWEVFRDVGFLGRVFVTLRWKILYIQLLCHTLTAHILNSRTFFNPHEPSKSLSTTRTRRCRSSADNRPRIWATVSLVHCFRRNGHLNLERKKKKNCHKPMLTHPQSCLTYVSTCSDIASSKGRQRPV